jgi:ParB family chromosome partitioning protein
MKKKIEWDGFGYGKPTQEEINSGILPMNRIIAPDFVERKKIHNEAIEELAENIKRVGLIQPLVVKKIGEKYEVIAGHRRFRALKLLGATMVQCIIKNLGKLEADTVKLSENIYREDLTDLEEAESLQHLMKVGKVDAKKLAKQIGKSFSYVQQKLDILKYPENIRQALQEQKINFSVARELIRLKNDGLRTEYLRHAMNGGATPAIVKEWVDDIIRAEKIERGQTVDQQEQAGLNQIPEHQYFCFACGEKATLMDSTLVRIHSKCQKVILEGE